MEDDPRDVYHVRAMWTLLNALALAIGQPAPVRAAAIPSCPSTAASGRLMITIAGRQRVVIVHAPPHDRAPLALIVNLHGSGSTAAGEERLSGMDAGADRDTFLVAYPEGAIVGDAGGFEWNVPGEPLVGHRPIPADAPDDIAFIAKAVSELEAQYCVDSHRVFVTGFSGGGRLASELACRLNTIFAAAAPVSGLRFPDACTDVRPVAIVAFHGTGDPINPYDGHGDAYWTYGVLEAARRWAEHDRCEGGGAITELGSGASELAYRCQAGAVTLYTLRGAGHTWPGGPALPAGSRRWVGTQSDAVDATSVMWRFFAAHPLP